MRRIMAPADARSMILPLDGVLVAGCLPGAEDLARLVDVDTDSRPDAVMVRYGEARRLGALLPPEVGLIVRLSGASEDGPDATFEQITHSVEGAAAIGADAVCATLKLGGGREHEMMRGIGRIAEECDRHGIVFLAEAFAIDADGHGEITGERPARAARVAQELGCDIVKIANPGDPEEMQSIASWCQVPIVVAGGDVVAPTELVEAVMAALDGGAAGVAIGRNVISHPDSSLLQALLADLVHGRISSAEAIASLDSSAIRR
jgi:DhnA family fructose-bisphosphate aldolase class Ia